MEIIIQEEYSTFECKIYVREKRGSQTVFISYDGEHLVETTLPNTPEKVDIKPLLAIPLDMKNALMNAFINEGAKQNLRTENENLLKGKLDATELHLEDMRIFSKNLLEDKLKK